MRKYINIIEARFKQLIQGKHRGGLLHHKKDKRGWGEGRLQALCS